MASTLGAIPVDSGSTPLASTSDTIDWDTAFLAAYYWSTSKQQHQLVYAYGDEHCIICFSGSDRSFNVIICETKARQLLGVPRSEKIIRGDGLYNYHYKRSLAAGHTDT